MVLGMKQLPLMATAQGMKKQTLRKFKVREA